MDKINKELEKNILIEFDKNNKSNLKSIELDINKNFISPIKFYNEYLSKQKIQIIDYKYREYILAFQENFIIKIFYAYSELENLKKKIKNEKKENLEYKNDEKYKKIKKINSILKSESNGALFEDEKKYFFNLDCIINVQKQYKLFKYKFENNNNSNKIINLKNYFINNYSKIQLEEFLNILLQISEILIKSEEKKVLLNISMENIYLFSNEKYSILHYFDYRKSKHLIHSAYADETNSNFFIYKDTFKIDILNTGKILGFMLTGNENLKENEIDGLNISSVLKELLKNMLKSLIISRYSSYQFHNEIEYLIKNIIK